MRWVSLVASMGGLKNEYKILGNKIEWCYWMEDTTWEIQA